MPFSSLSLKLSCNGCGQQTAKTLDSIRDHADRFDCAHCGRTSLVDQTQVNDELAQLAGAIDELLQKIDDLRVRLSLASAH